MTHCYHCGIELTTNNRSREHIIANAIGGRWKSSDLWCKKCNNHLGNTIDAVLAADLGPLALLLDIERERGENQAIKNTVSPSGEKFHLERGSTPVRTKPTVEINKEKSTVHLSARNKSEMLLLIRQLKKKYPSLDDRDLESRLITTDEYITGPLSTHISLSGPPLNQAILKMAVSAWLENTHDPDAVRIALDDLHRSPEEVLTYIRQYYSPDLCPTDTESVEHTILIRGIPEKKLLYAYVELFSCFSYVINLSENYAGPDYEFLHRYDVLTGTKSENVPLVEYDGALAETENLNQIFISIIQWKMNRLMKIVSKISEQIQVKRIVKISIQTVLNRHPGAKVMTREMLQELDIEVKQRTDKYIAHLKAIRELDEKDGV